MNSPFLFAEDITDDCTKPVMKLHSGRPCVLTRSRLHINSGRRAAVKQLQAHRMPNESLLAKVLIGAKDGVSEAAEAFGINGVRFDDTSECIVDVVL